MWYKMLGIDMISLIIPVYNEEKTITQVLGKLPYNDTMEAIVVDGGSSDRTVELACDYPVQVIPCIKNRAIQMNTGVQAARGDILVFLHSDCVLEKGSFEEIRSCLDRGHVGGCLSQEINSRKVIYRFIEKSGNVRARLSGVFYGDQAIFVRRDVFLKVGGFDRAELFDDVMFSRKLKEAGRTCVLDKKVYTSARRWEKQGIIKATLINWLLTIGFLLKIPTHKLQKLYYDIR